MHHSPGQRPGRRAAHNTDTAISRGGGCLAFVGRTELVLHFAHEVDNINKGESPVAKLAIGGAAVDATFVATANGFETRVVAKLPIGALSDLVGHWLTSVGAAPQIVPSWDAPFPVFFHSDDHQVKRSSGIPFGAEDLTDVLAETSREATTLVCAPDGSNTSTIDFVAALGVAAFAACRVLVPNGGIVGSPGFARIGVAFDVVLAGPEAIAALDGHVADSVVKSALRLRCVLGDSTACGVLGVAEPGWLWTGDHWIQLQPLPLEPGDHARLEAVFGTAFAVALTLGSSMEAAARYASASAELARHRNRKEAARKFR